MEDLEFITTQQILEFKQEDSGSPESSVKFFFNFSYERL